MKTIVFCFIAFSLPFLGYFQEMRVIQNGKVISEHSTYGQIPVAALMIVAAIVFFSAAWKERKKIGNGRMSRLVRFGPALFALPALWHNWQVSEFGGPSDFVEIKSGLGGPMTNLLLVAAAALFVALDAYWRQRENA